VRGSESSSGHGNSKTSVSEIWLKSGELGAANKGRDPGEGKTASGGRKMEGRGSRLLAKKMGDLMCLLGELGLAKPEGGLNSKKLVITPKTHG